MFAYCLLTLAAIYGGVIFAWAVSRPAVYQAELALVRERRNLRRKA